MVVTLDPVLGLPVSISVGVVAGVVYFLSGFGSVLAVDIRKGSVPIGETVLGVLIYLSLAAALASAVFCAVFAVLNPALQWERLAVPALQADLSAGTLSLRIVSLVLLVKAVPEIMAWNRFTSRYTVARREQRLVSPSGTAVDDVEPGEHLDRSDLAYLNATQFGLYLAVLTLLWVLNARDVQSVLLVLLSFALLFIVDDWVIISEYLVRLRGRLLRTHRIRIDVANAVICPTALWAVLVDLPTGWAVLGAAVIVLLVLLRYALVHLFVDPDKPNVSEEPETAG